MHICSGCVLKTKMKVLLNIVVVKDIKIRITGTWRGEKYISPLLHETAQGEEISDIVVTFDVSY